MTDPESKHDDESATELKWPGGGARLPSQILFKYIGPHLRWIVYAIAAGSFAAMAAFAWSLIS